jgi:hypothetical protein
VRGFAGAVRGALRGSRRCPSMPLDCSDGADEPAMSSCPEWRCRPVRSDDVRVTFCRIASGFDGRPGVRLEGDEMRRYLNTLGVTVALLVAMMAWAGQAALAATQVANDNFADAEEIVSLPFHRGV